MLSIEAIRALPVAELRRLAALRENYDQVAKLMELRDKHLEEARLIQNQIDALIDSASTKTRPRRKGPSVKALCIEALGSQRGAMTAAEVKNAILDAHPHRNNRTFYNQVFIALTRGSEFKKLKSGKFTLVGRASKR